MKLSFFGATLTVTGSKYLVEEGGRRYLVDCGLFQGYKELRLRNWEPFPIDPKTIDAVILTHAHLDHSGYLPLLIMQGFKGPIYATKATKDLCRLILLDSGRIQEEDTRRANRYGYSRHKPAKPLYTEEDAEKALMRFEIVDFDHVKNLSKGLSFTFKNSGHILGSAFVTLKSQDTTLVFSGDLGRPHDPIMDHPVFIEEADYLVLESTYGAREHPKEDPGVKLAEVINSTIAKGGSVVIPSFAVGRSQTVLYYISKLMQEKKISRDIPVYLDSPMAAEATDLWCDYQGKTKIDKDAVCHLAHFVRTPEQSKRLNESKTPCIIISASGMAEGGRVLHHIKHFANRPENTILFVGFQAGGTRGARLLRGEKTLKIHGEQVSIWARIEFLDSLSSHADAGEIVDWLKHFKKAPKEVFITHGEPEGAVGLKSKIEAAFGWKVTIPHYLESYEL